MNSETAILIAIVLSILIIVAVYGATDVVLDETGNSLFGDSQDDQGLFNPPEGGEERPFPEPQNQFSKTPEYRELSI
ncbi:hypothetical protein GLU60_01105 [Nanohaloarchaea archaeon H01]|nr:hypothetical protein [Nanohaloarchaea archaeon H01]